MKTIKKTPYAELEGVIAQAFRECCFCLEWGKSVDCLNCPNSAQTQLFRLLCDRAQREASLVN